MPTLHELRNELKSLRKESSEYAPISKLKKADVSSQIEKLRGLRETTPAPAAIPSAPVRGMKPAAESIKKAKEAEFPVAPAAPHKKAAPAKKEKSGGGKTKAMLMKMIAAMESESEEEE